MSIERVTMYAACCDGCGVADQGGHCGPTVALNDALDAGWAQVGPAVGNNPGGLLCVDCRLAEVVSDR